jgi:hypothetical protein
MHKNSDKYQQAQDSIQHMANLGILVGTVPIKKQTLAEKLYLVKNIDQCIDYYNQWIEQNPGIAEPVTRDTLTTRAASEQTQWNPATALTTDATAAQLAQLPSPQ